MGRFEPFDHTGDVGVHLAADSADELFAVAVEAFADTVTELERVEPREAIDVSLAGRELDLLLHDWLSELLFLFETRRLLARSAQVALQRSPDGYRLDATLRGERFDAARHEIKVLVKAVTYHALRVAHAGAGWEAWVIFDV